MALTKTPICDFGKKADNFELKSIDNKIISLNDVTLQKSSSIVTFLFSSASGFSLPKPE